jgi:hypothetical protein
VPDPKVHGLLLESFSSGPFPFVTLDLPPLTREGDASVIRVIAGVDAAGRVSGAGGIDPIGPTTVWIAAPGMVQVSITRGRTSPGTRVCGRRD